jgi:hypothetical protein
VVGIDAEAVVVTVLKDSDAVTELANVTPTVRTNIVDLMVVEENVVFVREREPSAKEVLILTHNNVPLTATLR